MFCTRTLVYRLVQLVLAAPLLLSLSGAPTKERHRKFSSGQIG
jgi:hypothetical protein